MADLRSELLAIRAEYGQLTPRAVVDTARDPDHVLHPYFEWDDEAAAEAYRLVQARALIATVKVTYTRPDGDLGRVREFHSIRRADGRAFEPVDEIIADEVTLGVLLRSMERDWRQLKARYDRFDEFWRLVRGDTPSAA